MLVLLGSGKREGYDHAKTRQEIRSLGLSKYYEVLNLNWKQVRHELVMHFN